jgi:hypothetical protein
MCRKAFALIMIVAISLHTGGKAFLFFWYKVSNGSFTEVFCVNQDRPQLHCNGQCKIGKLLKQQREEQQKQIPVPSRDEEQRVAYDLPSEKDDLTLSAEPGNSNTFPDLSNLKDLLPVRAFFHPPKLAC